MSSNLPPPPPSPVASQFGNAPLTKAILPVLPTKYFHTFTLPEFEPELAQQLILFCFAPAGSSCESFYEDFVSPLFNKGIVLVGINTPTKLGQTELQSAYGSPTASSVARYFDDLVTALTETDQCNAYPYAVIGHSGGALAAKGLVDSLQRRGFGTTPVNVLLSSCGWNTPSNYQYSEYDDTKLAAALTKWNEGVAVPDADLTVLRNDLVFGSICAELFTSTSSYPATVCGGNSDDTVSRSERARWSSAFSGATIVDHPGGHHYIRGAVSWVSDVLLDELKELSKNGFKVVTEWNRAKKMDWPSQQTLHGQFVEMAAKTPDSVAVIDGSDGFSISYGELDELSTLLAQYLYHTHAVRPGCSTGIFMERCWQFMVVYIAALKAGGAYMPLEVVYPEDLLTRVLDSSKPNCVVTKSTFMSKLKEGYPHFVMDGTDWIQTLRDMDLPPLPSDTGAGPDTMAYVVMSSGTTGTPKGICCPHAGAVHSYHFRRVNDPTDAATDVEACNVFFVWECLRSLLCGARMLVIPDEIVYDPVALTDLLESYKVTRMQFTPSLLSHTMSSLPDSVFKHKLRNFNYVNLCGEVVTKKMVEKFNELLPDCKLVNLYSISECHDAAQSVLYGPKNELYGPCRSPKYAAAGKVIPNVCLHVLDEKLRECPLGVFGEIYVSGPTVAIGYLNKPEQTAERFPPNPFQSTTEPQWSRIYRTGDRGRFLPDGQLEVAGRIAFFIKIRGYSVVPSAIEAALSEHPDIATAVVLAIGDISDFDKKLVAYVLPKQWELTPTQKEMREFCKKVLPPYSVPSIFVALRSLPVSEGTGKKLNTKALPGWEEANKIVAETEKDIQLRRELSGVAGGTSSSLDVDLTASQVMVAGIWRQICGIDKGDVAASISATDSFFDVGGSSLKLAEVAKLMSEVSGEIIAIKEIVGDPSLAAMSFVLEGALTSAATNMEIVTKVWRDLLNIPDNTPLGPSDVFADHGGHSLKLAQVAGALGSGLSVKDLLGNQTVAGMTLALRMAMKDCDVVKTRSNSFAIHDELTAAKGSIDLPSEAILEPSIYPAPTRRARGRYRMATANYAPRRVFLTGGTGYLGAFLLWEFVVVRKVPTYALVRAPDATAGMLRLVNTLKKYELIKKDDDPDSEDCSDELDAFMTLCIAVPGDLTEPLMGMERKDFSLVAGQVDAIVHCGADVNLFKSYVDLKKANVLGVQESLRLAVTNGLEGDLGGLGFAHVKLFYHVSSNGIFPANYKGVRKEDADLSSRDIWGSYHDGYGMTKWVGEELVKQSQVRGLPCTILRPGNMSASTESGVWNKSDFYALFLQAVIKMGCAPSKEEMDELGWELDLTPVNWAASTIVEAVLMPSKSLGQVLHIQNAHNAIKMSDVVNMLDEVGWKVTERMSVSDWSKKCEQGGAKGDDDLARCSVAFDSFAMYFGTGGNKGGKFDCSNLNHLLTEDTACPSISKEYLIKALGWCGVTLPSN